MYDKNKIIEIQEKLQEVINGKAFNEEQIYVIKRGLEAGLVVHIYAKPEFNWRQMKEIRLGLESSLDVSSYTNPKLNWDQMREIRLSLGGVR